MLGGAQVLGARARRSRLRSRDPQACFRITGIHLGLSQSERRQDVVGSVPGVGGGAMAAQIQGVNMPRYLLLKHCRGGPEPMPGRVAMGELRPVMSDAPAMTE